MQHPVQPYCRQSWTPEELAAHMPWKQQEKPVQNKNLLLWVAIVAPIMYVLLST